MIPLPRSLVLRRQATGLIRGVGLELCDRGGNVLATASGSPRVVVSDPAGQVMLVLEVRRSGVRVLDPEGVALAAIEQRSRMFAAPRLTITGAQGQPLGTLSGRPRAMKLCDADGDLVADVLMEAGAQVLILRDDPAEPLRSLVGACLIAANVLISWSRIPRRNRTAVTRWRL